MSTSAGTLTIDIEARVARLEEGMKKGARSVKNSTSDMDKSLKMARKAFLALGGVIGVGAFTSWIKGSYQAVHAADDLAQSLKINTGELQGLAHAGQFAGVSMEKLTGILGRQTQTVAEALGGNDKARKSFAELGLELGRLSKSSPDEAFRLISDRIKELPNAYDQARIANDIFGNQAKTAMGFIRTGSEDLAKMAEEGRKLGVVLSDVDVAKITIANDSMGRVGSVFEGIGNTFAIKVAPYLQAFSKWFTDSAVKADGWKSQIGSGLEYLTKAVGLLLDAFRGMQVIWKILEVAWAGFEGLVFIGLNEIQKSLVWLASFLPGLGDIKPNAALQEWADASATNVVRLNGELHGLLMEELPSDGLKRTIDTTIQEFERLAQAKAASEANDRAPGGETSNSAFAGSFDSNFLDKIIERGRSEQEALNAQYEQKRIDLENFYITTDMTDDVYRQRSLTLEEEYQNKLKDITSRGMSEQHKLWVSGLQGRLQVSGQILGQLADLMQSKSKKAFEVGKAAAIAETVINTYSAAQKAFNSLAAFPPAAFAAAAAVTAAGFVRVQAIRSQQFQGGGSAGSASGSFSASPNTGLPTAPVGLPPSNDQRSGNQVQVVIQGNVLGNEQFVNETLIPALANAVNNNDVVLISSNSRQAQEIVGA